MAVLERNLDAMGMEWTSRGPLEGVSVIGVSNSSPCWPTEFPKIAGKGNGMGRGQQATDRCENLGLEIAFS